MKKNTRSFTVNNKLIENFEFIVGPMAGVSIPHPPRDPEEFIIGAYNGGAIPIAGINHLDTDIYFEDIKRIKSKMADRYFGANILAFWHCAGEFIERFGALNDEESPPFIDINGIDLNIEGLLPLLKNISDKRDIYLGFYLPISLYNFKKQLKRKENAFLLDRFEAGTLKLYIPNNFGGGHLPILKKEQLDVPWADELLHEIIGIEEEFNISIPFIVEKGMMTVDDFVQTISKYSAYPNFTGVRFASNLELTKESGLNDDTKKFITDIVRNKRDDMIIPIRGCSGTNKFKRGTRVRGGIIIWVAATPLALEVHNMQCDGEDFPKYNRTYSSALHKRQLSDISSEDRKTFCHLCLREKCPREYCEVRGAFEAVFSEGTLDNAIIGVSPRIINLDPNYIDAPVSFVVEDIIEKTISKLETN